MATCTTPSMRSDVVGGAGGFNGGGDGGTPTVPGWDDVQRRGRRRRRVRRPCRVAPASTAAWPSVVEAADSAVSVASMPVVGGGDDRRRRRRRRGARRVAPVVRSRPAASGGQTDGGAPDGWRRRARPGRRRRRRRDRQRRRRRWWRRLVRRWWRSCGASRSSRAAACGGWRWLRLRCGRRVRRRRSPSRHELTAQCGAGRPVGPPHFTGDASDRLGLAAILSGLRPDRARRAVAQLVEHRSPKPAVGGSSPSCPAANDDLITQHPEDGAAVAMNRQTKRMMAKQGTDKPKRVRRRQAAPAVRSAHQREDRPRASTSARSRASCARSPGPPRRRSSTPRSSC